MMCPEIVGQAVKALLCSISSPIGSRFQVYQFWDRVSVAFYAGCNAELSACDAEAGGRCAESVVDFVSFEPVLGFGRKPLRRGF